jgi:hypothetical protein
MLSSQSCINALMKFANPQELKAYSATINSRKLFQCC